MRKLTELVKKIREAEWRRDEALGKLLNFLQNYVPQNQKKKLINLIKEYVSEVVKLSVLRN